jgi:hypothetical protein
MAAEVFSTLFTIATMNPGFLIVLACLFRSWRIVTAWMLAVALSSQICNAKFRP